MSTPGKQCSKRDKESQEGRKRKQEGNPQVVAIIYCNGRARSSSEQGSEARETRSRVLRASKEQDMRRNGGLGFSTDAAPPWVASALF